MNQAICLQCGTSEQDQESGFCINDHDDWLEPVDNIGRFIDCCNAFNVTLEQISESMKTGTSLVVKDKKEIWERQLLTKILKASNSISKARESQADYLVVSKEYLEIVMKNNNLQSTKEAEQLLSDVIAGRKTMKHG